MTRQSCSMGNYLSASHTNFVLGQQPKPTKQTFGYKNLHTGIMFAPMNSVAIPGLVQLLIWFSSVHVYFIALV